MKDDSIKSKAISELGVLVDRLGRDGKLVSYLNSPDYTYEEKKEYIEKKFSKIYSSNAVVKFFKLLVANNRHMDIKEIYRYVNPVV